MPLKIFFCYAHEDEGLLNKLKTHLRPLQRQGLIDMWHDRDISAGAEWEREIDKHLNSAQIILLLISSDFMDSEYCYGIEMKRALERHERGEARVIPIILRPVDWKRAPFAKLQALPRDAKPIITWSDQDIALHNVAEGLGKTVEKMTLQSFSDRTAIPMQAPKPVNSRNLQRQSEQEEINDINYATKKFRISNQMKVAYFGAAATLIAAILGGIFLLRSTTLNQPTPTPGATAASALYGGTLVLDDPLHDNSNGYGWDETAGHCIFRGGAYHVTTSNPNNYECNTNSPRTNFSNFAYQVTMKIDQGTKGGICFRFTVNDQTGYCFFLDLNGQYVLEKVNFNIAREEMLKTGRSNYFLTGLGKTNQIAVRAQGNAMDLFINGHFIQTAKDSNFSHGQIGVFIVYIGVSTEVEFTDAKVWVF